jgi:hypothetical protein
MQRRGTIGVVVACLAATSPAHASTEVLAPSSRTVAPAGVLRTTGQVSDARGLLAGRPTRLSGQGSSVVLDFGREVGGLVSLHFAGSSDTSQKVGLAFSESSLNVGPSSDASNGGPGPDGAIDADVSGPGGYTMPEKSLRGGFRYLTLFLASSGSVDIDHVGLDFTAAPAMADPSAYPNSFTSSDELLNRIWYAGAYTVQMDTIDPHQGRVWGPPASGWDNSATVGVGRSVLVDGAKRDRTAWPGDLGVSVPTDYAAFSDLPTIRDSLTTLYDHQDPATGALPYAGPAVNFPGPLSDTYHLWSLVATADYYLYSADKAWLDGIWPAYKRAVAWSTDRIGSNGLLYVTGSADWARSDQGKDNIAANVLLYRVLSTGAGLARAEGDTATAQRYVSQATALKQAINKVLWDPQAGAYKDNSSSTLHPQDGNALAVWFGATDSEEQARSALAELRGNWLARGAHTPEWTGIHPFPGSMEVAARFAADDDTDALDLIRREWGYTLNAPIGTGSTFWEGFDDDGSFAYESTGKGYTSLAHGWATGPTSALTFDVLGIEPDAPGGTTFHFSPHMGDLRFARGRLTTPAGPIDAGWKKTTTGVAMTLSAPSGTTARVGVPIASDATVAINGAVAWSGGRATAYGAHADGGRVWLEGLPAGSHRIVARRAGARAAACASRRVVTFHVRLRHGERVRSARLIVAGRRARLGGLHPVRVSLRGAPAGTVAVRLTLRLRGGRVVRIEHRYRTCAGRKR